jgi:hypothetical protein
MICRTIERAKCVTTGCEQSNRTRKDYSSLVLFGHKKSPNRRIISAYIYVDVRVYYYHVTLTYT